MRLQAARVLIQRLQPKAPGPHAPHTVAERLACPVSVRVSEKGSLAFSEFSAEVHDFRAEKRSVSLGQSVIEKAAASSAQIEAENVALNSTMGNTPGGMPGPGGQGQGSKDKKEDDKKKKHEALRGPDNSLSLLFLLTFSLLFIHFFNVFHCFFFSLTFSLLFMSLLREALAPPSHFGRKKRKMKGAQVASKLPSVVPTSKCWSQPVVMRFTMLYLRVFELF